MSRLLPAYRLCATRIACLLALVNCVTLIAADTPAPPTPEKCDCKPMKIAVTRAANLQVGPRADTGVTIQGFAFTGNSITINVGDTVTWTNTDGAVHTATSDTPLFDSGTLTNGNSYSFTFNTAGTFPYHCNIHPFMTGSVVVQAVAQPSMITSALTATAIVGQAFSYTLTATGLPAPTLSFDTVPVDLLTNGATISGTFSAPGQYLIGIHASNASGNDDKTLTLTVNTVPAISSALTATATVGQAFSYTLTATGSPAPTLSFTGVPAGFQTNGATITGTFSSAGQVSIGLHATSVAGSDDQMLVITAGTAASITSSLTATTTLGASFSYTLTATGSPTPTLSFTGVPSDLQTNGATISGMFTTTGQFSIGLHASNVIGPDDQTLVITVNPVPPESVITSPLTAKVLVGANFSYTLTATGTPAPTLSFDTVPVDLQTNGATISGTFSAPGQFMIGLHATNTAGNDDQTLILTVGTVPAVSSALTAKVLVGASFNYTLTAAGSPAPALSFTSVPSGFTVNGGALSGTFNSPGLVSIGIHASNTFGSDDQMLVVTAGTVPSITSSLAASAVVGASFNYTLAATGSPAPNMSFTNVPAGITANGVALSGTFNSAGQFSIGLHSANVFGSDDQTLIVTVVAAPSITSPLTASAVVGADFSYVITATGTPTISFAAGNLPAPLALTAATISGRFPTAGTVTLSLKASNSGGVDSKSLVVTVAPNTEGISGAWSGTLKGKLFDQTSGAPQSIPEKNTVTFNFTQVGSDLFATLDFAGGATYLLKGRIGTNNLWIAGKGVAGQNTVTLSGHVAKNGKGIKGEGLVFSPTGSEEFTFSLAHQ